MDKIFYVTTFLEIIIRKMWVVMVITILSLIKNMLSVEIETSFLA